MAHMSSLAFQACSWKPKVEFSRNAFTYYCILSREVTTILCLTDSHSEAQLWCHKSKSGFKKKVCYSLQRRFLFRWNKYTSWRGVSMLIQGTSWYGMFSFSRLPKPQNFTMGYEQRSRYAALRQNCDHLRFRSQWLMISCFRCALDKYN